MIETIFGTNFVWGVVRPIPSLKTNGKLRSPVEITKNKFKRILAFRPFHLQMLYPVADFGISFVEHVVDHNRGNFLFGEKQNS